MRIDSNYQKGSRDKAAKRKTQHIAYGGHVETLDELKSNIQNTPWLAERVSNIFPSCIDGLPAISS